MRPTHNEIQGSHERQRLARMTGEAFHAHLGTEDARRIARGAEDFVLLRAAEGDVAHHFARHRQMRQHFGVWAEDRDATLAGFRTMEIGDPKIACRIERTAVAAGTTQVVEKFGGTEQVFVRFLRGAHLQRRIFLDCDSMTYRLRLAGSTSRPLGNASPVATRSTRPSGRTRNTLPTGFCRLELSGSVQ